MELTLCKKTKRNGDRTKRYTPEERTHALYLVASGVKTSVVAAAIGSAYDTVQRWVDEAQKAGTMPQVPVGIRPTDGQKGSPKPTNHAPMPPAPTSTCSIPSADDKQGAADTLDKDGAESADLPAAAEPPAPQDQQPPALSANLAKTTRSIYAPKDPACGLSAGEIEAILAIKKKHQSMQPAQIRAQIKRFYGWRISVKAIDRVLREHGYPSVHRGAAPSVAPERFEAPRRNALWQIDLTEVRLPQERLSVLVIIDDFSRYVVGHALLPTASSAAVTQSLKAAIARHGKPEAIRTDRGGCFMAATNDDDFTSFLAAELIDHIVGRPYHPQGGGKVEAVIGTLKRELWAVEHFNSVDQASKRLDEFFDHYNHRRAHLGIDGLTPADRYFGRADRVLEEINARSRNRQNTLLLRHGSATFFTEELADGLTNSPLEVLRLVLIDGHIQLRFCGAQVNLGALTSPGTICSLPQGEIRPETSR